MGILRKSLAEKPGGGYSGGIGAARSDVVEVVFGYLFVVSDDPLNGKTEEHALKNSVESLVLD